MKKKNILLLSMSTLPIRDGNISESSYSYPPLPDFQCMGYSQLEPVPKLLMSLLAEKGERLDKIIILETDKTQDGHPQKFIVAGEAREQSAVSFFKERIEQYFKESGQTSPVFEDVPMDIEKPAGGMKEIVDILRGGKKNGKFALYLDIHGGLRDQQLVLEAIVSLLKSEEIVPETTYTVRMGVETEQKNGATENRIEAVRSSADIFGFVSGMNEFINYGRAESLERYFSGENELVDLIRNIANAIQLCDIREFENQIDQLSQVLDKEKGNDGFLQIFLDNIKNDYGENLLNKEKRTALELLRWCKKKKFYQQALTIIESRMPKYICEHYLELDLKQEMKLSEQKIEENGKKKWLKTGEKRSAVKGVMRAKEAWQDPVNYVFDECVRWTAVNSVEKRNEEDKKIDKIYLKLDRGPRADAYWGSSCVPAIWRKSSPGKYWTYVKWDEGKRELSEQIVVCGRGSFRKEPNRDRLNVFLQLHAALKNQRNQVNHASGKATGECRLSEYIFDRESINRSLYRFPYEEREPAGNILNAISAYIEMADQLNKCV